MANKRQLSVGAASIVEICELLRACIDGKSLDWFRAKLRGFVDRHGWVWFSPASKLQFNHRARLLYIAITAIAYQALRQQQLREAGYGWWVFRADIDCPEPHRQLDAVALSVLHPFWDSYSPPLGWECGCYLLGARSEKSARRLGGDPDKQLPDWWDRPDPKSGLRPGIEPLWDTPTGPDLIAILEAIADNQIPQPPIAHCPPSGSG